MLHSNRSRSPYEDGTKPMTVHNALACSCGCDRRIRVARSVLELAPIVCAGCAQPFEPDDDPR